MSLGALYGESEHEAARCVVGPLARRGTDGGRRGRIVAHSFINSVPRVENGKIILGDGGRRGGEFAFAPDESETALNERLSSPPKKKRR